MKFFHDCFRQFFTGSKRRTKINLTKVYPRGQLADVSKAELKLLVYLLSRSEVSLGPRVEKGQERDIEIDREIGIENQTENLAYSNLKEDFRSRSEYDIAIKKLLEKKIIAKSPKLSYYYVNLHFINHNYSHQNDALMISDSTKYKQ